MSVFAIVFLFAVLAGLAVRSYLAWRQIRHVAAHRDAVPEPFHERIDDRSHRRAADYTIARVKARLPELVVAAVWLLWLTLGGLLQDLHAALAQFLEPGQLAHGIAFIALIAVFGWAIELPFELRRVFVTEAKFGFNRISPALFLSDTLKGAVLSATIGLPLLAGALWLMEGMGQYWWLTIWAGWLAFNLLAMLIWPTFIAPLFNRFEPLEDEAIRERVTRLLERCGFHAKGLYVMDGSRRSAHGNAYFTGFGSAKRIVFFDTLLGRLDGDEIEAVLAHELGHFHHGHVLKRIVLMALGSFAILALLGWLADQAWFYQGLGMQSQDTAALLALFMLALPVFLLPLAPLMSLISRRDEYQADRYAAEHAGAGPLIDALVKLYRDNASTLTPDPWYSGFHDSHPPAALRIAHLERLASMPDPTGQPAHA